MPAYHWSSRDALACRQDVETLVALRAEEVPAALEVTDQAVGLVLRGDADAANAGIQRVRQGEIDDARLAAEIDGGLGALVGELHQPAAASAGEHIGHGAAREAMTRLGCRRSLPSIMARSLPLLVPACALEGRLGTSHHGRVR